MFDDGTLLSCLPGQSSYEKVELLELERGSELKIRITEIHVKGIDSIMSSLHLLKYYVI